MSETDKQAVELELARASATMDDRPDVAPGLFDRLRYVAGVVRELPVDAPFPLLAFRPTPEAPAQVIPLADTVVLGRDSPELKDLRDGRLSRRHFSVTRQADQFLLEDLQSRNGTFVNGARTAARILLDGDVIEAGRAVLVFLRGEKKADGA